MKIINLPKEISIRTYVNGEPKSKASGADLSEDMDAIEKNGYEILSATIMMEDRMIEATSKILFGKNNENSHKRQFFVDEVMATSDFSYSFKRRVFTRLIELFGLLGKEETKKFKADLNKIMEWRNAFAHGQVIYENNGGFILRYYSGGAKEIILDDQYFEKVESTIKNCLYTCNGIIQSQ